MCRQVSTSYLYIHQPDVMRTLFSHLIVADFSTERLWKHQDFLFPLSSNFVPQFKKKINPFWHLYRFLFYYSVCVFMSIVVPVLPSVGSLQMMVENREISGHGLSMKQCDVSGIQIMAEKRRNSWIPQTLTCLDEKCLSIVNLCMWHYFHPSYIVEYLHRIYSPAQIRDML